MTIISEIRNLGSIIEGRKVEIPSIQRAYAFRVGDTAEEDPSKVAASKLIEDLIDFATRESTTENYFLGGIIVLVEEAESDDDLLREDIEWALLDGQQRITSLTIIFNEIYRRLSRLENPPVEILEEILYSWIEFDDERYGVGDGWDACLYPRREDDRKTLQHLLHLVEPASEAPEGRMREAAMEFENKLSEKNAQWGISDDQLVDFYVTMRGKVLLSLTVTDDASLAFQMFETANARGTPLTPLDMFRAYCIKKTLIDFECEDSEVRKIEKVLNQIEEYLESSGNGKPDAVSAHTEALMVAWVSCRTGQPSGGGFNSMIAGLVESCSNYDELSDLVADLKQHAFVWNILIAPPPAKNPLGSERWFKLVRSIGLIVNTQHKALLLSTYTSSVFRGESENRITPKRMDALLELIHQYTLLCHARLPGKIHKNPFRDFSTDANMIWDVGAFGSDTIGFNKDNFEERKNFWIGEGDYGSLLNPGPGGIAADKKNRFAMRALVYHAENCNGCLEDFDPGKQSKDLHIFPLYQDDDIGDDAWHMIGNWFILRGTSQGGHTQDEIKSRLSPDYPTQAERDAGIRDLFMEHSSPAPFNNNIPQYPNMADKRKYVRDRTHQIVFALNQSLFSFRGSEWP